MSNDLFLERRIGEVGIERLRSLYSMMQGIPDERVELWTWRPYGATKLNDDEFVHSCKTVGCAVGWACSFPEFMEQGLYWDRHRGIPMLDGGAGNWDAVMRFFDLTRAQADFLFQEHSASDRAYYSRALSWDDYTMSDKRKVLARIRFLLLKQGVIPIHRYRELIAIEESL